MDEKIFCCYCKSSLLVDKERNQGYHDNCNNEIIFSQDFNFVENDDKQILEQIITQFNAQCISNYDQSIVSFSGFEQIEEWDPPPLLEIILGNGTEVSERKTLMKIQDAKLHHFSEELTAELWNILKKTEIGSISNYLPIMEKNNFDLLQKIHEIISFPNIYMKNDIILITPSRNTFDFEDTEIEYEEGEVLVTKDDEEIDYALSEHMITILLITGQDGKKRILTTESWNEVNRQIRKIPEYFNLLYDNIFHSLALSEQRFLANFKSNCLNYNILLEVGGDFDDSGSKLSLYCNKDLVEYPESDEYGSDFFFTFELTQGQNKKFTRLKIYYLDANRDTLNWFFELDWKNIYIYELEIYNKDADLLQEILNRLQKLPNSNLIKRLKIRDYKYNHYQFAYNLNFENFTDFGIEDFDFESSSFFNLYNVHVLTYLKNIKLFNATAKEFKSSHLISNYSLSGQEELVNTIFEFEIAENIGALSLNRNVIKKVKLESAISVKKLDLIQLDLIVDEKYAIALLNKINNLDFLRISYIMDKKVIKGISRSIYHRIQPIKTITFYFFDTGYFLNYYNWIERGVLTTDDVERSYFTGEEQCLKGVENLSLEIGQIRSKINLFFKNLKNLRQLTLNLLSPDEDPEKLFEPKELQKLKEIPKLTTIAVNERYLNKWSEIFKRNNMDYDIITIENE